MSEIDKNFMQLKFNLQRFINACRKAQTQKTTKGLELRQISGTFKGFKLHPSFGSGNLTKRPGLAFLKDDNTVSKGIFPIIVFIPENDEIIICKGVSYDNKPNMNWNRIVEEDIPLPQTSYNDEKGQLGFLRNVYSLNNIDDEVIKDIQNDINKIIEDY